jgi:putative transposase
MAQATSPASGRRYGVRRACQVWDVPRSSFYAARQPMPDGAEPPAPARRGPKPTVSDEALLSMGCGYSSLLGFENSPHWLE